MIIVTAIYSDYDATDHWNLGWCETETEALDRITKYTREAKDFVLWHEQWLEANPEPDIPWGANGQTSEPLEWDKWSEVYDEALEGKIALMTHQWPARYYRLERAPSYNLEHIPKL